MKYWIFCIFLLVGSEVYAGDVLGEPSAPLLKEIVHSKSPYGEVKADGQALERLDRLFDKIGGRQIWAEARSLNLIQRMRNPKIGDGILSMIWQNLEAPGEWGDIQHPGFDVRYAWSESEGWLSRNDKVRDFIPDEIKEKAFFWSRDLYTLYHQLALGEKGFVLEPLPPYGLLVKDDKLNKIAELHLTQAGEIYRWRMIGGKKNHETIFGPYKSFGQVSFPDWMTSSDGKWGAYQIQVTPSPKSFNEQVSLKKPVREWPTSDWKGGAVHSNCEN